MVINISKIKTEALLLFCRDIISSYKDTDIKEELEKSELKKEIYDISIDFFDRINSVTRPTKYYLDNSENFRIKAILKAYNYLNKELGEQLNDGMKFNPSMLYFSMLTVWFKELSKESKSKEYIYFLIYPYYTIYDKMLLNIDNEEFKIMNIQMIKIAEKIVNKYDKAQIN